MKKILLWDKFCNNYKSRWWSKEKKELEKIILCDVQVEIYPDLEKSFLNLINNSGYPGIKFEKKDQFWRTL